MKRFARLFISSITVCLAMLLSPLVVGAQEQVYDYHVREEYFDFSTIFQLVMADKSAQTRIVS